MSLSFAIFTFINAWWITLFFVLPFGVKRNDGSNPVAYAAAPQSVNWRQKILITSLLAAAITGILALIINSGLVPIDTLV